MFFIYCEERKKEHLKSTIHYRKMDADCPVPRRMSVIVVCTWTPSTAFTAHSHINTALEH